ncbi:MAG: UvrD-helicase domain-containing protein [Bacteroidales bacterium]|nr:UvrD-helicase domain-containing protein [Bacteroidales bacterium]
MSDMERALNPFVICKAAAGSGKTFTLVKEYLKLAMALPSSAVAADRRQRNRELRRRFRGILAITFTNKAANQMKTKVLEYLDQIVDYGVDKRLSPMGEPLLSALNAAAP